MIDIHVRLMLMSWWLKAKYESLQMWVAWHLPRSIAMWATVRLMAHASQQLPTQEMDSLTPAQVLKSWTV